MATGLTQTLKYSNFRDQLTVLTPFSISFWVSFQPILTNPFKRSANGDEFSTERSRRLGVESND